MSFSGAYVEPPSPPPDYTCVAMDTVEVPVPVAETVAETVQDHVTVDMDAAVDVSPEDRVTCESQSCSTANISV